MCFVDENPDGVNIAVTDTSLSINTKILIVDDFSTMRKILGELGLTNITEACDGSEALTILSKGSYGLLIPDWNMPVMSGADLLKAVRAE